MPIPIIGGLALKAAFGGFKSFIGSALSWVADHPWQSATIALGALTAWHMAFTIPGLEDERDAEIAAHQRTKADYREAQRIAAIKALEQRKRFEDEYRRLAEDADNDLAEARITALSAADRFIAANRVRCAGTGVAGPSGGTDTAPGDSGAGLPAGSGGTPELVATPARDIRICTDNTLELERARSWALGLESASRGD